eukprot:TRINITY_DN357_c0_g1_i1.p2 TRINITY_DN357_c0_g1~~TRINITY_DN357_c0_g1_i1.p2  ORF type:complete len:117 (+),score=22.75 TRINITY_DN357_c0_g1_i1:365-715(+)
MDFFGLNDNLKGWVRGKEAENALARGGTGIDVESYGGRGGSGGGGGGGERGAGPHAHAGYRRGRREGLPGHGDVPMDLENYYPGHVDGDLGMHYRVVHSEAFFNDFDDDFDDDQIS